MRCGCASADITPEAGVQMSGYTVREQPSVGIHDPLTATALYLEDGAGGRLLWLHADVIGFERADVARMKCRVSQLYGQYASEVIITGTHTHSGPATIDLILCGDYEAGYVRRVEETFIDIAGRAITDTEETSLEMGEGCCTVGIHRRPAGAHTDPRLTALAWRRPDGSVKAALTNYAVHHVSMSGENRLISADMAGRAARGISAGLPGAPCVVFTNGPCGNINPPSVDEDWERMEAWGDEIARVALDALACAKPVAETSIRTALRTVVTAPGRPSEAEIERTMQEAAGASEKYRRTLAVWRDHATSEDAAGISRREVPVDIHIIAIGPLTFAAFGAEVFSQMRPALEERTGRNVVVVGYANGDAGYLCPESAYDEGGYEPAGAYVYYGTNPIPRGAFERVRDTAAAMISSL